MLCSIALVAFAAEEAAKKDPISAETRAEWWEMTATQTSLAKQFSDAQSAINTIPAQFVKNGEALEALKAKMAKDCEVSKEELFVNPQTNKPSCVAKQPATSKKDDAKKEPTTAAKK